MPLRRTAKARGSTAERDIVHRFWDAGWAAFRAPASGSMGHELPDIIAGHGNRKVAIECKVTADGVKYIPKREVEELLFFAHRFGCEAWLGVKFLRRGWFFLNPEDCRQTAESYVIPIDDAERKGLSFEELVR